MHQGIVQTISCRLRLAKASIQEMVQQSVRVRHQVRDTNLTVCMEPVWPKKGDSENPSWLKGGHEPPSDRGFDRDSLAVEGEPPLLLVARHNSDLISMTV